MIEAILIAPDSESPQQPVPTARLSPQAGLEGDRHSDRDAIVSLIEAEAVEAFNATTGLNITPAQTRRNIVTRGVRLNDLEARKRFHVGDAEMEFFELCEPCATLGASLATDQVSATDVVKAFTHSGGIRARVLSAGDIQPGTKVG
jgi:MOSC domain-containing protein YiiM